jgi:serine-type D-Ala-D-Ala carboxypeptidase (penicillin-binding protein 5/6)
MFLKRFLRRVALFCLLMLALNLSMAGVNAQTVPPTTRVTTPAPRITQANTPTVNPSVTPKPPTPTPGPKFVPRPPDIKAPAAIAVDFATGRILYAKNPNQQRPQASTTKTVTALTFLNMFPDTNALRTLDTTVVKDDLVGEANMGLRAGERIKLWTLLLGLMTNSANEAGVSLARYAGQKLPGPAEPVERFVGAMNAYALSLGMYDTHFMNPHGLDQPGHYSSAYDLALSGWYYLRNPVLMQLGQYQSGTVEGHWIYNVNSFLTRYPGANGVKPGWTDAAGRCLVASSTYKGRTVIAVVLDSPNVAGEIDNLMDYSFTMLEGRGEQSVESLTLGVMTVPRPGAASASVTNSRALQAALKLQLEHSLRLTVALAPK